MPSPDAKDEDDGVILSVVLTPSQVRLFLNTNCGSPHAITATAHFLVVLVDLVVEMLVILEYKQC